MSNIHTSVTVSRPAAWIDRLDVIHSIATALVVAPRTSTAKTKTCTTVNWDVNVAGSVSPLPFFSSPNIAHAFLTTGFGKNPKTYLCRQCTFAAGPCCAESGVANHPHPMITVWYKRTVPSDNFWQSLIKQDYRGCDGCGGLCLPLFYLAGPKHCRILHVTFFVNWNLTREML